LDKKLLGAIVKGLLCKWRINIQLNIRINI
jgi:hypothetical protein